MRCNWLLGAMLLATTARAQSILPPALEWHGKSEALIARANNPWITPAEKTGFNNTPAYTETMNWLRKLDAASPLLSMVAIGKSAEGRDIQMVIASAEKNITPAALKNSTKPLLLVQAGIHSGEIDGKDAGLMLLRDIAFEGKKSLLDSVNFLFIPILSVDAHERSSPYNRPNQRGPENMGWRTNAQNLNLNRDYAKLDTREIRAVMDVINAYDPLLYMDIHVTDGADYQYDITFGGVDGIGYSPAIENWLAKTYKPFADKALGANGHIPGSLVNAFNDRDFSEGNVVTTGAPRFSDSYGDARHLAAILVENHSLKPYKQRVLGTCVLLESTLQLLAKEGTNLKEKTRADKALRPAQVPMAWKIPMMKKAATVEGQPADSVAMPADSIRFLGIESEIKQSAVTNAPYVAWLGKPVTMQIADYKSTQPADFISRPKGYWVPAAWEDIIERLKLHGIQMTTLAAPKEVAVEMYRIAGYKLQDESGNIQPFEGHMQVDATTKTETRNQRFEAGSVYVSTDQPLGDLAMLLLEPLSKDSYFSWGFFLPIFQRTEYIEAYVMEPMAKKMLDESPALQEEFRDKKASDATFANNPAAILSWFYSKTKFYDDRYLLYPVARVL